MSCASTLTSCVIYTLEHQLHHLPETEDSKFVKAKPQDTAKTKGLMTSGLASRPQTRGEVRRL